MRKKRKSGGRGKLSLGVLAVLVLGLVGVLGLGLNTEMAWAAEGDKCGENGVETAILGENGCWESDDKGTGVIKILTTVVDIMTVGVGILGVIGITVVGLMYLTAGGNENKTQTAKRRMMEIVIGLVAYMAIYAILKWLLPGFDTGGP